ncbi:MAG: glycosyltransferase family 9 protein [bacterium]|nr:glycosyltransferase family 9 protein [bacterium]
MDSKEKIIVSVECGLGDHITAEPSIRYLIEKVYPDKDIHIFCGWPRVFSHLNATIHKHNGLKDPLGEGVRKLHTFPATGPLPQSLCFLVTHISDFHSASLLCRTLPLDDKTIKLVVNSEDKVSLALVLGDADPKNLVLVHAGKSWKSKTFPASWWLETINALIGKGMRVCLVGKRSSDISADSTGIVEFDAPLGVLDLRDKLDIGTLFALVSEAPVLLSNDSSLIQIAGAFDNWIAMIATCKHPDLVFPYRNSTPRHKTLALYKRLLVDDWRYEPIRDQRLQVNVPVLDWTPYLPDPEEVAREINKRIFNF